MKEASFFHVTLPNPEDGEIHVTAALAVGNTGSVDLSSVFSTAMLGTTAPLYQSGERFEVISELAFYFSLTATARTLDETATTGATRGYLWPANTPLPFHIHIKAQTIVASGSAGPTPQALQFNYKATGTQRLRFRRASRNDLL